jgi:dTMP kinase
MGISLAIEGIDGSGKRTLAENLKKKFEALNIETEIISFPRHQEEFSGELVDKFLYEGLRFNDDEYKEIREGMLYAIDRMVSLGRIRENGKSKLDEYNENKLLIFDRYLSSNFIHRCNDMKEKDLKSYINTMKYIEFKLLGLPEPDITLVLSVKPEVSYQNILNRGRETDENETIENLTKAYNNLQRLCDIEGYVMIDCCKQNEDGSYEMLTREEITEKAWEALEIPDSVTE